MGWPYTADEFHTWYRDDCCGEADQGVYYEDGEGDNEFDDVRGQDDDGDILFGRRKGKGKGRRRFHKGKGHDYAGQGIHGRRTGGGKKATSALVAVVAFLSEAVSSTGKAAARAAEKESPVTKVFVTTTTVAT